jgi:hypothetical protein
MKRIRTLWKQAAAIQLVLLPSAVVMSIGLLITLMGCGVLGGGKSTIVQITNKITSLPAGQTYQFTANVQHDQKAGVTLSLTGAGTLVLTGTTATYLAPPAPPSPNSVTVTVTAANGSGVSDSDTFTIAPATGPVVSITPTQPTATAGGASVTLNIAVTMDDATDTLTPTVSGSSNCNGGVCGTFGSITGTAGSGAYTVEYFPPSSVTASTLQIINVTSTLTNSTQGTAFVTISP